MIKTYYQCWGTFDLNLCADNPVYEIIQKQANSTNTVECAEYNDYSPHDSVNNK